jgi:hypothetical protein
MRSACSIVDKRCAITSVVHPFIKVSSTSYTARSDSISSADVASSRIKNIFAAMYLIQNAVVSLDASACKKLHLRYKKIYDQPTYFLKKHHVIFTMVFSKACYRI